MAQKHKDFITIAKKRSPYKLKIKSSLHTFNTFCCIFMFWMRCHIELNYPVDCQ